MPLPEGLRESIDFQVYLTSYPLGLFIWQSMLQDWCSPENTLNIAGLQTEYQLSQVGTQDHGLAIAHLS